MYRRLKWNIIKKPCRLNGGRLTRLSERPDTMHLEGGEGPECAVSRCREWMRLCFVMEFF